MSPAAPPSGVGRLYDPVVVFVAGALMAIGVAMVYSASVTVEGAEFDLRQWWNSPLRQCVFAFAGFLVMLVAAHVDYRMFAWERRRDGWRAGLLALLALALLVAVFVPGIGRQAQGARRAIVVLSSPIALSFQPAEVAKVVLVIWLAALLTRPGTGSATTPRPARDARRHPYGAGPPRPVGARARRGGWRDWLTRGSGVNLAPGAVRDFLTGFLPAVLSAGLLIGLTGIEDFGTAALMGAVMLVMLLAAGARWSHLGLSGLAAALAGAALVLMKRHRIERITSFFADNPDPAGAAYQINQAILAIGSGGWWGLGLGNGVQKYGYLPQDNNDFILAIVCEELGVVGSLAIAGLFLVLLWRGWRIAAAAPDRFGRLLALGLTLTLCLQAAFNIAVVTHSVPTKGISLPFVSAGGSGVVFLGLAAGLLAAVGRARGPQAAQ